MAKRDTDYYARRLQRDRPEIWQEFLDGKHKSLAEARRAAGLGGQRTRVHELKNAWRKATPEQRDEFLAFLEAEGVMLPRTSSAPATSPTPTAINPKPVTPVTPAGQSFVIAQGGYLTQEAKDRINQIIDRRGLRTRSGSPKVGVIMKELTPPFSPLNASLGSPLGRGTRLKKEMIETLERWLTDNTPMVD